MQVSSSVQASGGENMRTPKQVEVVVVLVGRVVLAVLLPPLLLALVDFDEAVLAKAE